MSQPVICVEALSKSYLIGHQGSRERYTSLRDTLSQHTKNFSRRTLDTLRGKQMLQGDTTEEFWALKDVSFEVQQGDVLGIIGRNGAGKSTLLKVLSRITEPTSGKVTIRGRVASLLEVGTGFHPELSGRENIFLNGAILGMSRKEIKAKFDEIVDFAGVEKFLDTPVKRYSSGMYVRLAFAVAAHLEPEILVVDEVLAVGDSEFQKKCMGKMKDVAGEGRTVLFVSHNMPAISSLSKTGIYLKDGEIAATGSIGNCLTEYLSGGQEAGDTYTSVAEVSGPMIRSVRIVFAGNQGTHFSGDDFEVEAIIDHPGRRGGLCFSFHICDREQRRIAHLWINDPDFPICRSGDSSKLVCKIPNLKLNIGSYTLAAYLLDDHGLAFDIRENICGFSSEILHRQSHFGWRTEHCAFLLDHQWETPDGIYEQRF